MNTKAIKVLFLALLLWAGNTSLQAQNRNRLGLTTGLLRQSNSFFKFRGLAFGLEYERMLQNGWSLSAGLQYEAGSRDLGDSSPLVTYRSQRLRLSARYRFLSIIPSTKLFAEGGLSYHRSGYRYGGQDSGEFQGLSPHLGIGLEQQLGKRLVGTLNYELRWQSNFGIMGVPGAGLKIKL